MSTTLAASTSAVASASASAYATASATASATATGSIWQPTAGTSWNIQLLTPLDLENKSTYSDVDVLDFDLFDNSADTISTLHDQNKKVICYFSAGSYEPNRADSSDFKASDKGKELDGWPGEYWLDTKSANVRSIMKKRIALAASKGCDGVDPDNTDAYDNENGLDLTEDDAKDYVRFLAAEAKAAGLAVGLKNSGAIIPDVVADMAWAVNEQCVQYNECDTVAQPFIDAGKPVFGIEYPDDVPDVTSADKDSVCGSAQRDGMSTLLKDMDLDGWFYACPLSQKRDNSSSSDDGSGDTGAAAVGVERSLAFAAVVAGTLALIMG